MAYDENSKICEYFNSKIIELNSKIALSELIINKKNLLIGYCTRAFVYINTY